VRISRSFGRRPLRRTLPFVPLCLAVMLVAVLAPQRAAAAGWTPLSESSEYNLTAVACCDAAHVWAVGAPGVILQSSNGGVSWKGQMPDQGVGYFGVACADPMHVWAVGGALIRTTDGGATWTEQDPGMTLYGIACADTADAWAVGWAGPAALPQTLILRWNGTSWK